MLPLSQLLSRQKAVINLLKPYGRVSLSQFGEDVLIAEYLAQGRLSPVARYIDLGCFHPLRWSNTAGLYLLGWRGLNVDANERLIAEMRSVRTEDVSVCTGIAASDGVFDFYSIGIGASSTIDEEHKTTRESKGAPVKGVTQIQCVPIMTLLRAHLQPEQLAQYEYIDIDLEGLDETVVAQIDWDWLPVKLVTVEIHVDNISSILETNIYRTMLENGFQMEHFVQATAFFYRAR